MQCARCNSPIAETDRVRQVGDLEVYRCSRCGHEMSCMVSRPLPDSFFDATPVRAIVTWSDPPKSSEIAALRKVVPEFAAMGFAEVMQAVADRASWSLGVFPRAYVQREVVPLMEQHGLNLEIEPA